MSWNVFLTSCYFFVLCIISRNKTKRMSARELRSTQFTPQPFTIICFQRCSIWSALTCQVVTEVTKIKQNFEKQGRTFNMKQLVSTQNVSCKRVLSIIILCLRMVGKVVFLTITHFSVVIFLYFSFFRIKVFKHKE